MEEGGEGRGESRWWQMEWKILVEEGGKGRGRRKGEGRVKKGSVERQRKGKGNGRGTKVGGGCPYGVRIQETTFSESLATVHTYVQMHT